MGKKTDWDSWSEEFLLHGKWKGYKRLLVSTHTKSGVKKVLTQEEYENALEGNEDLDKKIVKLGELNELAYKDLILSINKVAFGLGKNEKSTDFLEGN